MQKVQLPSIEVLMQYQLFLVSLYFRQMYIIIGRTVTLSLIDSVSKLTKPKNEYI